MYLTNNLNIIIYTLALLLLAVMINLINPKV